ncbi:MAG: hypothetical protein GY874_14395, partial [Desulfobacteraceae bacterium]|nr:hypothetical protein [Desulfobacteraceae bacterium]
MANYSPLKFTKQGKELQAKVQTGCELTFKHIAVGSGVWEKEVNDMTQLVEQQTTIAITEIKKLPEPGKWLVQGVIEPDDYIETGYRLRECGIYAKDPDNGNDILYMATTANPADYIPGKTEEIVYTTVLNFVLTISDEANVTVCVDNATAATKYDLALHEQLQLDPNDTDSKKIRHLSNAQANAWQTAIGANTHHRNRTDNPHSVTKSQVGLSKVPNTDFTSSVSSNTSHREKSDNPHKVTKTQIGLSKVPNTDFTSSVASNTSHRGKTDNPHRVTKSQVGLSKVPNVDFTASVASNTSHRGKTD